MYILFGLFGLFSAAIFLILIFVSLFTKKKMKRNIIGFFACSALFFVCLALTPGSPDTGETNKSNTDNNFKTEEPGDSTGAGAPIDLDGMGEVTTLPIEEDPAPEIDRDRALKIDSAIWQRVLSSEKNYNTLLETMSSATSLYSLYSFCDGLEGLMVSYISDIGNISDDLASEYVECAGIYMAQIDDIAGHIKKYANKNDMKELSKAEEGMRNLATFTEAVVIARFSYLSACGFSDEEITEIGDNASS